MTFFCYLLHWELAKGREMNIHKGGHLGSIARLVVLLLVVTTSHLTLAKCTNLDFLTVRPKGTTPQKNKCNPSIDKNKCLMEQIVAKFGRLQLPGGEQAWTLEPDEVPSERLALLQRLKASVPVTRMNEFKILARSISKTTDVCEPNLIYLGMKPVIGVGPVFVDGLNLAVQDGGQTTIYKNFMLLEDAVTPDLLNYIPLLPEQMLSLNSLEKTGYLKLALAHEMAHSLMQDLYGLSDFGKVMSHHHSRAGHFASATTDPALAWVEGFAEGFEAYLGEVISVRKETPYLDKFFERVGPNRPKPKDKWENLYTILSDTYHNLSMLGEIDGFMSDFLLDERQNGIPSNQFVLSGQFVNLSHKYEFIPVNPEQQLIQDYITDSTEAIYSKEGAVAHLIYFILKKGLARPMFEVIAKNRPMNVRDFVLLLQRKWSDQDYEIIRPAVNAIFTRKGRSIVSNYHFDKWSSPHKKVPDLYQRWEDALRIIDDPKLPTPPRNLWVEFLNPAFMHVLMSGQLDRINLAVATPIQLDNFVRSQTETSKKSISTVFDYLGKLQSRGTKSWSAKQWGADLIEQSQYHGSRGSFEISKAFLNVGLAIVSGADCFAAYLDPKRNSCWGHLPKISTIKFFTNELYDYVQSGEAREDFFFHTDFGQWMIVQYQNYLEDFMEYQKNNPKSQYNLITKYWTEENELISTTFIYWKDPQKREKIYEVLDNYIPGVKTAREYWSDTEKKKQMEKLVFDEVLGWEEVKKYWKTPQGRDQVFKYAFGETTVDYWKDSEKREEIYRYAVGDTTVDYWKDPKKREQVLRYGLGDTTVDYWQDPKKREQMKEYVIEMTPGGETARQYWATPEGRAQIEGYAVEKYNQAADGLSKAWDWTSSTADSWYRYFTD